MPRTINEGFLDFLRSLTPTDSESAAATSHRASIEACLKNNFGLLRLFRTGSFGNGTSIAGHSDVDYFASIPTKHLKSSSMATLRLIRDALDTRFPNTGVRIDCPAVKVPFGYLGSESTEIVPADLVKVADDGFHIYDMPNFNDSWMISSPEAHNAYVRKVNTKLGYKVKPLVRFIKAWKFYNNVPMSSFYLEIKTTKYADGESSILYNHDVRKVFRELYDSKLASMQDPLGIAGYIHSSSTQVKIDESFSKVSTALTRANNALEAESKGNIKEAFEWWSLLFGGRFPSYYR